MIYNALGGPVKIEQFVPHVTINAETGVVTYPPKSYFYQGLTVDPVPQSLLDEAYQRGYEAGVADAKPYSRELEYIQSTGTQYIDVGFKPNQNTRIVLDIDITAQSNQSAMFGSRNGSASGAFCLWTYNNNNGYQDDFASSQRYPVGGTSSGRHTIDKNKNVLTVDGSVVNTSSSATFTCSYNVYLFSINSGGSPMTSYPCSAKLYSCKIYENGTLVRDFIPVLNKNNTPCLYDKVTGNFYYNSGSGTFNYS